MHPIKIAFAGAGGYADYCLGLLLDYIPKEDYKLVGIADPFVSNAPRYDFFVAQNIPMYDTVEALFEAQEVDALYVASPITFHKHQCEVAMARGCAILCEKPLTATYADTKSLTMRQAESKTPFAVGFQWSFTPAILQAKQDILNGRYGKPLSLKAYISWQRFDDYYQNSSWKGRVTDDQGQTVNDSVVTNATAHYLHNIFFMMGQRIDTSMMPSTVCGSVYRAKPIESFDSCFLKGVLPNGAIFLFLTTHSGDENREPVVEYCFERGSISIDANQQPPMVRGVIDGEEICYGTVSTPADDSHKIKALFATMRGEGSLPCPIEAVLPHQAVCTAIFEQLTVQSFPTARIIRTENPSGDFVAGLSDDLAHCFTALQTPAEAGFDWAGKDQTLTFDLQKYGDIE